MNNTSNDHVIVCALEQHVAIVELRRPPHNFFDFTMISALADCFEQLDTNPKCRAIVLCAQGKSFCAGADFSGPRTERNELTERDAVNPLYDQAIRIFACSIPVIVAVEGAAIGGGLGLALVGDFRVTCPQARFSANFTRLGFHPGFGLSHTLPRLIGGQNAALLFYTGRRIGGKEAFDIGLADQLVEREEVRSQALALAQEIAISAPLAVRSTRTTLRNGLVDAIRNAIDRESHEQYRQWQTEDFREGVTAMEERRPPIFNGR